MLRGSQDQPIIRWIKPSLGKLALFGSLILSGQEASPPEMPQPFGTNESDRNLEDQPYVLSVAINRAWGSKSYIGRIGGGAWQGDLCDGRRTRLRIPATTPQGVLQEGLTSVK